MQCKVCASSPRTAATPGVRFRGESVLRDGAASHPCCPPFASPFRRETSWVRTHRDFVPSVADWVRGASCRREGRGEHPKRQQGRDGCRKRARPVVADEFLDHPLRFPFLQPLVAWYLRSEGYVHSHECARH